MGTEFVADLDPGSIVIADRVCEANPILEGAAARCVGANIPPRVIRKDAFSISPRVQRQRSLVERFFSHIDSSAVSPRDMTGTRTTTWRLSSSPPSASA